MNTMNGWLTIAAFCSLPLIGACQPVEEQVSEKDRALELLNERQYDQAIAVLKKVVATEPDDAEAKVLLASAYVGSVDFNVVDAYGVFEPVFFGGSATDKGGASLTMSLTAGDTDPTAISKDMAHKAIQFLDQFNETFRSVARVPHVPEGARGRLNEGLMLLTEIMPDDAQYAKAQAYAGVINALQFLNYARDTIVIQVDGRPATFLEGVCGLNVRGFLEDLEVTSGYLLSSMTAFEAAYKAKSKPFSASLSRLRDTSKHVQEFYQSTPELLNQAEVALNASKASYCAAP